MEGQLCKTLEKLYEKCIFFFDGDLQHAQLMKYRITKCSLNVTQGHKYKTPSEDRTRYSVATDLMRQAC